MTVSLFVATVALISPLLLQILRRLLQQLNTTGVTVEQQLTILLELEYLVHQVWSHHSTHTSRMSEPLGGVEGELQHCSAYSTT